MIEAPGVAAASSSSPELSSPALRLSDRARQIPPVPDAPRLSSNFTKVLQDLEVTDEYGDQHVVQLPVERQLAVVVDGHVVGGLWTLGPQPEWLVLGYLCNRRLVNHVSEIDSVTVDWSSATATVATRRTCPIDWRNIPARPQGEARPFATRDRLTRKTLLAILDSVRGNDAIYRAAGSVQGCALFCGAELLISVEDVSRRNCFDVISGWMVLHGVTGNDKILFSTGRLTAEVISKAAISGIPTLISRKGITSACFDLASRLGMTLIGHAAPHRYLCYAGAEYFDPQT